MVTTFRPLFASLPHCRVVSLPTPPPQRPTPLLSWAGAKCAVEQIAGDAEAGIRVPAMNRKAACHHYPAALLLSSAGIHNLHGLHKFTNAGKLADVFAASSNSGRAGFYVCKVRASRRQQVHDNLAEDCTHKQ